jgi:hypothetical protein
MKPNKLMLFALCLFLALNLANSAFSQSEPQKQGPESKAPESPKVLVFGKIAYLESQGGYFIKGDGPYDTYEITNQIPELLEPFIKSGQKVVRFQGYWTVKKKVFFIEKLDGKPYVGTSK